ncbi:MAG TPA: methyltransferase domain-containing protein [Solirubrobacterales bacterium]|jgi:glycosyltransferase involved in cell wall biosynthesis
MKILDCGAHDGYVALWLARRLREQGHEVQVDGIELNADAVEVARRRFADEDFAGEFAVGDALDVASHVQFEPGSYDAVIAFEVIEHVPEPQALLEALETMCKPDGAVYISTPDGTFGTGQNPHHLRVFRAVDLADLLRRRGQLRDMVVGHDGVTAAAYTPIERRGEIAIYAGPGWETWSPHDIESRGLGGSETAAIRLAQQLSEIGYVVTVYGEVEQCAFRDVIYRHHSVFDPMERRLAVIASRIPEVGDRHINARSRLLWMHDTDAGDRLTAARAEAFDHVLVLSRWHEEHVSGMYPFLRGRLRQTRNGIEHSYFAGETPERKKRVLYTSSPDRGLDILLELWPKIREQVPDAELAYCYSEVYDRIAEKDATVAAHRERIRELAAATEGTSALGSLPQQELARLMRTSLVWAHPSYATPHGQPFHETSCIGAMEAQAAGCVVVASDWGALSETVKVGRLVNSGPLSDRWRAGFVREIVDGLRNTETQKWAQIAGPKAAADLGWGGVARQVAGLIEGEVVEA